MNSTAETLRSLGINHPDIPGTELAEMLKASRREPDDALTKAIGSRFGLFDSTADTLAMLMQAGAFTQAQATAMVKATISTGTGLVAFDLQAPAKNLYPFFAPIRNFLPRVGGGTGTSTNWRQVNAIIGSGWDAMGWVPEGQRSGQMSYSTSNRSATFVTVGEEAAATYEAISAGRQFEDIQARMTFRLLQKMMRKEEMALLAGNASVQLGTPTTPTVSAVTNAAATLPTGTYYVQVVGLTMEGYQNAVRTGVLSVPTIANITGADGQPYALNGGASNISAESAGQAVTSGTTGLGMTTPVIAGAVAYAWFISAVNTAGTETLQAITTINSYQRATALAVGNQPATAITADYSANPSYAFDGLFTTAIAPGSNAYVSSLATGTVGVGTPLTASGRGSVTQIDQMFKTMWDNFLLSPTVMYVNSQELQSITTLVLTGGSAAPLLRYNQPADGSPQYNITASGVVDAYYNPFAPPDAGMRIPIRIHDRVPPGTIVTWAQNLPVQYQSNEVPNVAEVKTRQDYYQIDWPIVTRQRQVGVYAEEVLAVYAPFAMGILTNIAPT